MENKKKLILCRGIQGSGKTFWAKAWVAEDPEHRIRINNDDIRNMLGTYWVTSREDLVSTIKKETALNAMLYGYDIVVDNMNLNPKEVKFWEDIVNNHNKDLSNPKLVQPAWLQWEYEIEFKDFFIPLEECIRRDAMRPNPIGEKVIRDTWKRYKHFIQTTEVEKYVNNLRAWDIGKPTCVVVDMDSTLCFNITKRPWYGKGSTEGMINDIPNGGVCDVVFELQKLYPIVLATGRDTSQEEVTKQWLLDHEINISEFYFRTEGDYRKGVEVKREQIEKILEKYNILAIFEDSEPIVQMYRNMGLTVLQPNKGL
jgi:predicted kinase